MKRVLVSVKSVQRDMDGKDTVVDKDGKAVTGYTLDKDGNVVDGSGKLGQCPVCALRRIQCDWLRWGKDDH